MRNYKVALQELVPGLLEIFEPSVSSIILYGSVARGTQTEDSDIDVAVIVNAYTRDMEGSVTDLSVYRFQRGEEDLEAAKNLYKAGEFRQALNRSYYSIFHGMRSVNASDGFDSRKHSGVIAHFNQHYVKTEVFPKESSKIIKLASFMREKADYEDFFAASR